MNTQSIYGDQCFGDTHEGHVAQPAPQPSLPPTETWPAQTSEDRIAALIAHGGTFFAWMLAPIVVYLVKRNESRYAEFHALQSLLWSLLGTVVAAATCGLAIPVFMVFHGIATYKTLCCEHYEYPIVARIAKNLMA